MYTTGNFNISLLNMKVKFSYKYLPCNSANAFITGFWFCINFALSNSSISNDDDDGVEIPPVKEDIGDGLPGTDVGTGNCPGKTGDGEFEDWPEGEVIGFKVGLFLSNLKCIEKIRILN